MPHSGAFLLGLHCLPNTANGFQYIIDQGYVPVMMVTKYRAVVSGPIIHRDREHDFSDVTFVAVSG